MQVFFAAPAVAAPSSQSASAELPLGQAGDSGDSFASLLDSNTNPASDAPPESVASRAAAPMTAEEAEAGESVADDQGIAEKPEETLPEDAWLAAAAQSPFPLQPLPAAEFVDPAPVPPAVSAPEAGIDPPATPTAPDATGVDVVTKAAGKAGLPRIAAGRHALPQDVAAETVSGNAEPTDADIASPVMPAETETAPSDEFEHAVPLAKRPEQPDASAATRSAGAAERAVPAVPVPESGDGTATPAIRANPAERAADQPALPRAQASDSAAISERAAGDTAAMRMYPGLRVSMKTAEAAAQPAASSTTGEGEPAVPAASPVVAAPTLAQMLVESSRGRTPRGSFSQAAMPTAEPAVTDSMGGVEDAAPGTPALEPGDAASATFPVTREEKNAAPVLHTARENLALTNGKSLKPAAGELAGTPRQNFLSVEQQEVGEGGGFVGTSSAKDSQPMTAHAQVMPTATPSTLDASVAVPALANRAETTAMATGGSVAESAAARADAVDAVRETLEAAERAQQTGRNHVELRLQTSGSESLRVHLRLQDGVVHAKFVTQSNELQQALSREWDLLAPRLAERGIKFGETSFENRDQSGQSTAQNAFTSGQQRQHTHDQGQAYQQAEERAFSLPSPTATTTTASRRSPVAMSAIAATPASLNTAEARSLRAWA
jgi:hypothetical protein